MLSRARGRRSTFERDMLRLALADANEEAERSLAKLVWLRDNSRDERVVMDAAIEIKNTVWGRPAQQIRHTDSDGKDIPVRIEYVVVNSRPDEGGDAPSPGHERIQKKRRK